MCISGEHYKSMGRKSLRLHIYGHVCKHCLYQSDKSLCFCHLNYILVNISAPRTKSFPHTFMGLFLYAVAVAVKCSVYIVSVFFFKWQIVPKKKKLSRWDQRQQSIVLIVD